MITFFKCKFSFSYLSGFGGTCRTIEISIKLSQLHSLVLRTHINYSHYITCIFVYNWKSMESLSVKISSQNWIWRWVQIPLDLQIKLTFIFWIYILKWNSVWNIEQAIIKNTSLHIIVFLQFVTIDILLIS